MGADLEKIKKKENDEDDDDTKTGGNTSSTSSNKSKKRKHRGNQGKGHKKGTKLTGAEEAIINKKRSKKTQKKYTERQKEGKVEQGISEQFMTGRVLASISSRPGQCGRADGYILEGKELEFYLRKIKAKKGNK